MSRKPMSKKGAGLAFLNDIALTYDGDECLTWPFGCTGTGYAILYYEGRKQLVSRIICQKANGPAPTPEHEAAHSCGNGHLACIAKRHLQWKTPKENVADQLEHGTRNRGERQGLSKITADDVRAIRASNEPNSALAKRFGIAISNVSQLRNRKSWSWLDNEGHANG